MTKNLVSAAFACAALAMPGLALADDAMGGHDAMAAKAPAKMATMVCRPAAAGEKPTAMMMGDAKTAIVCKTMNPAMMMKKGSGPDLSKALTAEQADAAWRSYIESAIMIPGGTGGG
ncbi:MAG: hypothetical protein QOJ39_1931 [Candidatus Eremiobacteraeota bacterium]|nr:hypothetical protein [Candidatus Eremiobacteraeota bacterium]MEA2720067.1 hypothetical protein [Candidatus Eremiobacteraeota bacterium]